MVLLSNQCVISAQKLSLHRFSRHNGTDIGTIFTTAKRTIRRPKYHNHPLRPKCHNHLVGPCLRVVDSVLEPDSVALSNSGGSTGLILAMFSFD